MQLVQPSRKKTLKESYMAETVQGKAPKSTLRRNPRADSKPEDGNRIFKGLAPALAHPRWRGCYYNSWIG
eukprot:4595179-Pleurochrysis_carterae.AAC.1